MHRYCELLGYNEAELLEEMVSVCVNGEDTYTTKAMDMCRLVYETRVTRFLKPLANDMYM